MAPLPSSTSCLSQSRNVVEGSHYDVNDFHQRQRTLTGEEVDRAVKSVVDACAANFQAKLRA